MLTISREFRTFLSEELELEKLEVFFSGLTSPIVKLQFSLGEFFLGNISIQALE